MKIPCFAIALLAASLMLPSCETTDLFRDKSASKGGAPPNVGGTYEIVEENAAVFATMPEGPRNPDGLLGKGTIVQAVQAEKLFSKVKLESGEEAWIDNEFLEPAPGKKLKVVPSPILMQAQQRQMEMRQQMQRQGMYPPGTVPPPGIDMNQPVAPEPQPRATAPAPPTSGQPQPGAGAPVPPQPEIDGAAAARELDRQLGIE